MAVDSTSAVFTQSGNDNPCRPRAYAWQETAAIFVLFFLQGSWPVPDVNEPYYVLKAVHFWNPQFAPGDFFLDTVDTHLVFYFTLGWLSSWLSLAAFAWCGRLVTWALLAWSWQRLSASLVPRPWFSILAAALFAMIGERYHLAGEWVIGGIEAKGFAWVVVLLGLRELVVNRWNRAWLLLGVASALHVLVGGWSVAAAGLAWLMLRDDRPALRQMAPALAGGFAISLVGLVPSLRLNWGAARDVVDQANQIYVFERFPHHLDPMQFPGDFVLRFVLVSILCLVLFRLMPAEPRLRRMAALVYGSLAIAAAGAAVGGLQYGSRPLAAALLRFYWFRMADVAVPLGVALAAVATLAAAWSVRRGLAWFWLGLSVAACGYHFGDHAEARLQSIPAVVDQYPYQEKWLEACHWVATSGRIEPDAVFLTPLMSQTFKWYAHRAEVANWKESPQDAQAIVDWWRRVGEIYGLPNPSPESRWYASLSERGVADLRRLAEKYRAGYVICLNEPRLPLDAVYENETYVVYRMR